VAKVRKARLGHVLSFIAVVVSWTLAVRGAYEAQAGWTCALFITMACLTEPSKLKANQIIWGSRIPFFYRLIAAAWYGVCICISVMLLHMPSEIQADQSEFHAATRNLYVQRIEAARKEMNAAQNKLSPAPSIEAAKAKFSERLSSQEKMVAQRDLDMAVENGKLQMQIDRLRKEIEQMQLELSLEMTKHPPEHAVNDDRSIVHVDAGRSRRLNDTIYIFAFVLELTISLGIWADGVHNRKLLVDAAEAERSSNVHGQKNDAERCAERSFEPSFDPDLIFEMWLQHEWKSKKTKDGWLITTQRGIADHYGMCSAGAIHGHLKRLSETGRIEKVALGRKTHIRFVETTTLRLVKG
jgi:hypothetical protein